jgi:hypothetical protein
MRARLMALLVAVMLAGGCQPSSTPAPGSSLAPRQSQPDSTATPGAVDPTSEDLIAAALAAGRITEEQSLLDRALAIYDSPELPAEFHSPVINLDAATELFSEVDAAEPGLSADLLAKLAPYRARPADPISIFNRPRAAAAGQVVLAVSTTPTWESETAAGGKARVWVKAGPDAQAQLDWFAPTVTRVWANYPGVFTFPDPDTAGVPSASVNPDAAIDFYFVNAYDLDPRRPACEQDPTLSDCVFGFVNDGYAQSAPPYHSVSTSAYLVLNASEADPDNMVDTIAHELAHAGQFAYDRYETSWLKESTASWVAYRIMKKLELKPTYAYDRAWGFYLGLDRPLTRLTDHNAYGSWLYFQHLAMEEDASVIAAIWEAASAEGVQGEKAVDQVLAFDQHFPEFAVRNWNQHPVEPEYWTVDKTFPDYLKPGIRSGHVLEGGQNARLDPALPPLAAAYFDLSFQPSARSVTFTNALVGVPGAHVWAIKNIAGTWERPEDWSQQATKKFCRDTASEDLSRLIVIVSNASMTDPLGAGARPEIDASTDSCQPPPEAVELEGTLIGKYTATTYDGSIGRLNNLTAHVKVRAPLGPDSYYAQDGGTVTWSGAWEPDPGDPTSCYGSGSADGTLGSEFVDGPAGTGGLSSDALEAYGNVEINDGPVGTPGGPTAHGTELLVELSVSSAINGTCPDGSYPVLGIGVPSCAPFILAKTAPGIFSGSCSSDDGTNHIEWTGEIRQVSP